MSERWRLVVEELGMIERAEVDIHPLMLLVGPNNTGKSYLASLLWGLLVMQADLEPPQGPALQACDAWMKRQVVEGRPLNLDLSSEDIALFDGLFASALAAGRDRLVSRVFHDETVTAKKLELRNTSSDRGAKIEWAADRLPEVQVVAQSGPFAVTSHMYIVLPEEIERVRAYLRKALMQGLTFGTLTRLYAGLEDAFNLKDPIFLPASRTGFMQLYKAAARRSLREAYRRDVKESAWLELTAPAFHFIDMLAFGLKASEHRGRFAEEADLLETAINGRVELSTDAGINEFRYLAEGVKTPLSMAISSSLVTELAPVVLVLRHLSSSRVLILEEPEAHLHPELQRRLAQVIVRLIRKGLYVWITTHSENFCQQINNFLKLGALDPDRRAEAQKRLGYDDQDYLELDEVGGYEFKPDRQGRRSSVVQMKKTPRGIVMPTFNASLLRLGNEVEYLDQLLAEE